MAPSGREQGPDEEAPLAPDEVELHESDPFGGDPETGSSRPDPSIQDTGAPPMGDDPMAGPAPSG
jgi:hypothetical protein